MALQTNALSTTNPYELPELNNTIDANVKRIGYYHWAIKNKLKALGVKVPASAGDDTSTSARDFVDTDHINTTYAALNAIALQNAGDQTVSVGGSYTVPVGYVSTSYTVLGPTLNGNATAANVLEGKTFYSNSGTKQTGTMTNYGSVLKSVGIGGSYTIPAGYHNGSGTVTGPILSGNATADDVLKNITFYSNDGTKKTGNIETYSGPQSINLNIAKTKDSNNKDVYTCTSGSLNTGYYKNATITYTISLTEDTGNSILNIYDSPSTSVTLNSKTGTISVPDNYDFQTARNYSVKEGSASVNSADFSTAGEVTVSGTATEGWVKAVGSKTFTLPAYTRKGTGTYSNDYYTVGTGGYIAANSYVGTKLSANTSYNPIGADADLTFDPGTIITGGFTVNKIAETSASFNSSSTSGKTYTSKTLSSKTMYVDIPAGYISDTRWSITAADFVRASTSTSSADYYKVGTGGYIAKDSYVGSSVSTTSSYNPVNAANNLSIAKGTVLANGLTVNKISVGAGSINSATLGAMTAAVDYTTSNDNAAGTETYMNKFTVDPTGIIAALQEI